MVRGVKQDAHPDKCKQPAIARGWLTLHGSKLSTVIADDLVGKAMLRECITQQRDHVGIILSRAPPRGDHESRAIIDDGEQGELAEVAEVVLALEIDLPEVVGKLTLKFDISLAIPWTALRQAKISENPPDCFD